MKKILSLFLVMCMLVGLSACIHVTIDTGEPSATEQETKETVKETEPETEETIPESETENNSVGIGTLDAGSVSKNSMIKLEEEAYYDYEWDDENGLLLASVEYHTVFLDEKSSKTYPELAASVKKDAEKHKKDILEKYAGYIDYAANIVNEDPSYLFGNLEISEKVTARRADSKVLSVLYETVDYAGGVHPDMYYRTANYDAKTGKRLTLYDVMADMDALYSAINEQMDIYYSDIELYELAVLDYLNVAEEEDIAWTMDYNGITFFFNPYNISSYADGAQIVMVSFDEYPGIIDEKYRPTVDSYTIGTTLGTPLYYDLDEDGILDVINTYGEYDNYAYTKQSAWVNGYWSEEDIYSFSIEPVLVHMGADENYLYIRHAAENDYATIEIIKISSGEMVTVDEIAFTYFNRYDDSETDYGNITSLFTDTNDFVLRKRVDALSTSTGYMSFKVGENGVPVGKDKWFTLVYNYDLTALIPIEADIVDDATGEFVESYTIPAGAVVTTYRMADDNSTDVVLSDGRVARIAVDSSDWPHKVNGIDIEQVFEGMMFAG